MFFELAHRQRFENLFRLGMNHGFVTLTRRVEFDRATDRPHNMTAPERPDDGFVTRLMRLDFPGELRRRFGLAFLGDFQRFERENKFLREFGLFFLG